MALESGKNIRWAADQLGHADPPLTLRVYSHLMKSDERDLSFAEFGPKRPYTAPGEIEANRRAVQPREILGGPSGTRTLDHRVKRTNRTQEVTRTYSSCLAGDCNRLQ